MVIPPYLERAKKSMVDLLLQFKAVNHPFFPIKNYALEVPKEHPALIGHGTNSLVFSLPTEGGKVEPLIGKCFMYDSSETFEEIPKNVFHLVGNPSGLVPGDDGLAIALHWLGRMGLDVTIPPMQEFPLRVNEKPTVFYTIMPDLRGEGKYSVEEASRGLLSQLDNGDELIRALESDSNKILEARRNLGLTMKPAGHGTEEDLSPAIEHLFLVQHDGTSGKLFLADLNHLAIYENGHRFGKRPSYLDE